MKNKAWKKSRLIMVVCVCLLICTAVSGCGILDSKVNDIKGKLVGNDYNIYFYDNLGNKTGFVSGEKVGMTGNPIKVQSVSDSGDIITTYQLSSIITLNIDGHELETCGDTMICAQKGLEPDVDFKSSDIISESSGKLTDNAAISGFVNKYKNMFGKSRVIVVKSQLGQPITAYSGEKVYWEAPEDLPKMTKLMIDGKALYVHRDNFQIIDKDLLTDEK